MLPARVNITITRTYLHQLETPAAQPRPGAPPGAWALTPGKSGARSRRCHQVKQLPGWTVTQPKPGWHAWTTPTGRTHVREPWRYTA
jgi:hypothetical protein